MPPTDTDYVRMARLDYATPGVREGAEQEWLRIEDVVPAHPVEREDGGAWVLAQVWVGDERFEHERWTA